MLAHTDALDHARTVQTDRGVGPTRPVSRVARVEHPTLLVEGKVALGAMIRVGHQPQVSQVVCPQASAGKCPRQLAIKDKAWHVHIGGNDPKSLPQQWQGLGHATGGLQRTTMVSRLVGVVDAQAPTAAITECRLEPIGQVPQVDDHVGNALACHGLEMPNDQRLSSHAQQRLWGLIAQRSHALAASCGEDEGGQVAHKGAPQGVKRPIPMANRLRASAAILTEA